MMKSQPDVVRWFLASTAVLLLAGAAAQEAASNTCPPEAEIMPCRCTLNEQDLQIWCSHSDLPKVLAGLRAAATHLTRPIDELILENNNLPSLPGGIFSSLRVIRIMLRDNGLERVASTWLAGLEDSLLELFVVEPQLRSIPMDSLDQLRVLEAVTIQAGATKRMPRLSNHPRLRYIRVQSPTMVELMPNGFKSLSDLEELHITSSPRLTRLEAGLFNDLPRLRLVNISDCGLTWIHPRAFSRLPSLSELSLGSNRLSDAGMIGRAIRDLPALSLLRLNNNVIERLAEASFVDLRTLTEVNLSGNRITELQRGAFHLVPALRRLDLSFNRVYRVHPESFLQRSDSGLQELWLDHNEVDHIGELRAVLETLPRLRYLDMSYNFIREIPFGALHGHPTLERLHLDHNHIQHIQREAFMAMPALRELRLRNNSLSNIVDGPMWNLPGLKGLDLSQNIFRRLDAKILVNLPALRRLDISGNALGTIDQDTFIVTPSIEHVNLSGNTLVSIHPTTFQHLRGLYELDVGLNQLREIVPGLPRGIEYLRMPRNQITVLPEAPSPILKLPALKLLDLSGNGISRIPIGSLGTLSKLRYLNLGENAVQQLEEGCLNGLKNLEVLDLHDNRILRIHSKAFRDVGQLKELDLHSNRIESLQVDLLQGSTQLKSLDISRNQLASIPHSALVNNRDLEKLDASRNGLTEFPEALSGLTKLQTLDLSSNRLKQLTTSTLNTLTSLTELRLAKNKFQEIPEGTFRDLPNLTLLDLDSNELEKMASRGIRSLPSLRAIRLSHNRLPTLPEAAFSDLPELLSAELQDNQLTSIASNAFKEVPLLAMLNLSYNQLEGLEKLGLHGLKSLEVLDLSHNKVDRVGSGSLAGMEGLVELKMGNNRICGIYGSPFNSMGRLRVLSLSNNRIASLSEPTFQHLRNNIAVLDVAGNPLSCSCGMLWFQNWLQETSDAGPTCADGSLLREVRLSRQNCDARKNSVTSVAPGCEAEGSIPLPSLGTSQVISTWMEIKGSTPTSLIPPSPEESEYFYDEYVEYPLEVGNITSNHSALSQSGLSTEAYVEQSTTSVPFTNGVSSHYITGDTPTLYAGVRNDKNKTSIEQPKQVPHSPPRSGLTFFGIPLPSLNINGLWGGGGVGRKSDAKPGEVRFIGARGKVQMLPPTAPKMENGFTPMRPQSGGFMPIVDPQLRPEINQSRGSHLTADHHVRFNYTSWNNNNNNNNNTESLSEGLSKEPSLDPEPVSGTARSPNKAHATIEAVAPSGTVNRIGLPKQSYTTTNDVEAFSLPTGNPKLDPKRNEAYNNNKNQVTSTRPYIETEGSVAEPSIEPNLIEATIGIQETSEKPKDTSVVNTWGSNWFGPPKTTPQISDDEESATQETTTVSTSSLLGDLWGMISAGGGKPLSQSPSSLSALLVPGGQLPQFKQPGGGKPTITKVTVSPPLGDGPVPMEEYLRRTQSNSIPRSINDASNFIPETAKENLKNESMQWYFQNYNRTNLKPFVGPGKRAVNGQGVQMEASMLAFLMALITLTVL